MLNRTEGQRTCVSGWDTGHQHVLGNTLLQHILLVTPSHHVLGNGAGYGIVGRDACLASDRIALKLFCPNLSGAKNPILVEI